MPESGSPYGPSMLSLDSRAAELRPAHGLPATAEMNSTISIGPLASRRIDSLVWARVRMSALCCAGPSTIGPKPQVPSGSVGTTGSIWAIAAATSIPVRRIASPPVTPTRVHDGFANGGSSARGTPGRSRARTESSSRGSPRTAPRAHRVSADRPTRSTSRSIHR